MNDAPYRPAHACGNCEGIDPESCIANPDRRGPAAFLSPRGQLPKGLLDQAWGAVENPGPLVQVGWWCWRGDDHGHLVDIPCRSDNVPLHVPAEWATEMRALIQHLTDAHEPGADCTWVTPEEQAFETLAAADPDDER